MNGYNRTFYDGSSVALNLSDRFSYICSVMLLGSSLFALHLSVVWSSHRWYQPGPARFTTKVQHLQ